ncbi:hypothetical protein HS125_10690 [bacterium]|nr:hypothetical protein [bacterium]
MLGLLVGSALAAADWPAPVDSRPAPSNHAYGLAWDGRSLWTADYDAGRMFELNPDSGAIRRSLGLPCRKPTGLAWDGRRFWVASESTARLYRLEPRRGRVEETLPAPVQRPAALAWTPEGLWLADRSGGTLYLIDSRKGQVLRTLSTEAVRPRGLAWDGQHLWLHCALNQAYYCLDPKTGDPIRVVYSPSGLARGLAWGPGGLWVACRGRGGILHVPFVDGDGFTLSDPITKTITMTHRIENQCDNPIRNARITLAVPPTTERQRVHGLVWSGSPTRWITDPWGASFAVFQAGRLALGEVLEASWTARVEIATVRWCLDDRRVGDLASARASLAEDYYADTENYCLSQPATQAHARAAVDEATLPLAQIAAIRQYLFDKVEYVLEGGWQDALTVLERGTGSCSEYTYCFNGLLRANGFATRNIGSTVYSSRAGGGPWEDRVFHRWLEIYLPGYGWVPFDANTDDVPADQPPRKRRWGAVVNRLFITHITPRGGEDTPLYWNYNSLGEYEWTRLWGPRRALNQRRAYWSD